MQILGRKVKHSLVVLKNVQDKILGIDFIRQHALSFNAFSLKCHWETPTIDSGQLKSAERIYIEAFCSRKIKLKCVNEANQTMGITNTMIA